MPEQAIIYGGLDIGSGSTADTNRIHSPLLWDNAPLLPVLLGQKNGWYYKSSFDRALTADTSTVSVIDQTDWDATVATTGTALTIAATAATGATQTGGILDITAGATTDGQGIQLQQGLVANIFLSGAAGEAFWYETRIRPVTTVAGDYFLGLANTDTSIITTGGGVTTTDHIGFSGITGDGVLLFNVSKASSAVTAAATTLVADTWIKLGFYVYYNPVSGTLNVQQFINGVPQTVSTTQVVPNTVAMRLSYSVQSSGSGTARIRSDWVEALHVYASAT